MAKNNFQAQNLTASEVVNSAFTDFTIDVAAQKVAGNIDGLKSIHRRILWAVRNNKQWINLDTFVGKVIEIHPVGDKSITDACVRLTQDFSMGINLLIAKGNSGDYSSEGAGAARYLRVDIDPMAHELFFDGIDMRTLPMKSTEDFMDVEPVYFIPKLPTSLLIYSLTLGVGFKSEIYPLQLENVCTLVQKYITTKSQQSTKDWVFDTTKYNHLLIPDFPTNNYIRNTDALLTEYNKGKFTPQIVLDGVISVTPNSIVIKTAPFGVQFESVELKLRAMLKDKKHWISELFTEYSNLVDIDTEGALAITFKRGVDTLDIVHKLIKELNLSKAIRNIPVYVNRHGLIRAYTPYELLKLWYNFRQESIVGGVKTAQISLTKQLLEKQTKLLVYDYWDDAIAIIRHQSHTPTQVIDALSRRFDLSYYQAKILANAPLLAASKSSKTELATEIEHLKNKELSLNDQLGSIDDTIYKDTEYFKTKYRKPRRTKITPYIGYISVADKHLIQFDDFDEAQRLLSIWNDAKVYFYSDPKKITKQYALANDNTLIAPNMKLPKYLKGQTIWDIGDSQIYTLGIVGESATILEGLHLHKETLLNESMGDLNVSLYTVGKNFVGICADGSVVYHSVNDFISKKKFTKRGTKTKIIHAFTALSNEIVLIYMNTINPDTLQFCPIVVDKTAKVPMSVMGSTEFIGAIPLRSKTPIMFNLPPWNTVKLKYVTIPDITKLLNTDDTPQYMSVVLSRRVQRDPNIRSSLYLT